MSSRGNSFSTRTTIISIVILDLIIMGLFLFFSDLLLKDFQYSSNLSNFIISGFAIVIPGTLFILIVIQINKLRKNRLQPGNNFKKNIVLYFVITILLINIPHAFISINFIRASTDNWLNRNVRKAVNIGFTMALENELKLQKDLEQLSKNKYFRNILKEGMTKELELDDLKSLNSTISAVEFYSENGKLLKFITKNSPGFLSVDINKKDSFYPKAILNELEILRYQFYLYINSKKIIVVISNYRSMEYTNNGYLLTKINNSFNDSEQYELSYGLLIYYAIFSIPLILLGVLGSFIFSDEVVRPISDIEKAIKKVARGNYSYRILSKRRNEFNILITSFNNMIKDIEKSRNKLKHTEQISTWQDIATRLAHEIRNPLTPIKLSAQRVLLKEQNKKDKTLSSHMETIIHEVTRMEKLLNEFRDFARFPQLNLSEQSLKESIDEAISIYKSNYPDIIFNTDSIDDMNIVIDRSQIIQVISNLAINSIHAMENIGKIEITGNKVQKKGNTYCRISLKDSGKGIPKENIPNLFKPYYTTKYNGSGLGLAIVNKIILDHKGKIWIESAVGKGTTFYIELPLEAIPNE